MRTYEIDAMRTETRMISTVMKDTFEFRKDLKFHWVQKLAFKVLRKIGCYSTLHEPIISRHVIRPDDIMQNLFEQNAELMDLYDSSGGYLLIGPEEYQRLTSNPDIQRVLTFNTEYHKGGFEHHRIHGMQIKVIPWMKGMLVIPNNI